METDPKIEVTVRHYETFILQERIFRDGKWWVLVNCENHGSQLTGVYRISGYQGGGKQ